MKNKRIFKILGWGLTTGLVLSALSAMFAAPAAAGEMEWTKVNTPSWEDLVILYSSDINDYDIGGDGDTIYAVLEVQETCNDVGYPITDKEDPALVKSVDGGVTWTDITDNVTGAANLPDENWFAFTNVAVAPDDEDWVAVAGYSGPFPDPNGEVLVVASKDGGSNFSYTGDMYDADADTWMSTIFDLDVSIEVDGIHNIAVAGENDKGDGSNDGAIFRLKAGTWLSDSWADTSDDPAMTGWNDSDNFDSEAVVAVEFSPNFDIDDTIVCMTISDSFGEDMGIPYLQSGIWESGSFDWNAEAGFTNAAEISSDGDTLITGAYIRSLGFALPEDYDGSDPGARSVFTYVNAYNTTTELVGGYLFRIDNGSIGPVIGPSGEPLLASIDVHGDADTGKIMIGEYVKWDNDASGPWEPDGPESNAGEPESAGCCEGVRVWHTSELDFCCPQWEGACKDPSGPYMALVMYTPDGEKEYATTRGSLDEDYEEWSDDIYDSFFGSNGLFSGIPDWTNNGTPCDESAFSVSLDDAVSFNQIGLIDTDIDYLSNFVACPDCSVYYLATINDDPPDPPGCSDGVCNCDSVWRSYDEGDTWERVFHGDWSDRWQDQLLLRLPCDDLDDCCTIYLGIQDGDDDADDDLFYSRDCGQCWNSTPEPKVDLHDFAVESENIVYMIDEEGMFTMSTQYGRRWTDSADIGLDTSHTIAACCDQGFIVVGPWENGGKVAWSDDGGESWNLTDALPSVSGIEDDEDCTVHIACDPVCENIVYAAVNDYDDDHGAIFRTDLTDGSWSKISKIDAPYTGIAIAREGTLYASFNYMWFDTTPDPGDDWCLDRMAVDYGTTGDYWYSGAARNLDPCDTACCGTEDWDYLICGITGSSTDDERFDMETNGLKICGCLSSDTNTKLFAIDSNLDAGDYIIGDGSDGCLWVYEDCAAKHGPELMSPADDAVIDCDPCASCDGAPFTLKWERMCNACSYDIQIMDEDGNVIVEWVDEDITGDPPSLYVDEGGIQCGNTYTWHVRMANTDCECVHSPWSETWSFTIAVGAYDAIQLLAPDKGATGISISNVGFSWTSVVQANSYQFVLSPNANLTGALASQSQGDTAFNYMGDLDYGKVYYWQVKAFKGDVLLTTSSTGVFTTMEKPEAPTPPVVVNEYPPSTIEIPPAEQITPTWIYAVIGIGAALIVVVIVLIVRTRRP